MKFITKYNQIIILIALIAFNIYGFIVYVNLGPTTKDSKPEKVYPVRVYLYGETYGYGSSFDCDSANLNYAWKDGIKIQLKDVYQIKFN